MKNCEKLVKEFKEQYPFTKEDFEEIQSDKIELDNLDYACLVYDEDGNVLVENEHCTKFDVSELSNAEVKIFLYNL